MRENDWTRVLGWPGYNVYRHEIGEPGKRLTLWVRRKPALRQMGVDEIFAGKKQKFITVVSNLQTYRFGQGHTFFGFSR